MVEDSKETENRAREPEGKPFFEIVNWKKAQPKMKGGGQSWLKLYTSLLYHDGFARLSATQQMTIVALWLYAAVSGHHILPADPKWLFQRIPLLKEPPDLGPLAEALDSFGNPNPFIKFCDAPKPKKDRSKKTDRERERERDPRADTNPTGSEKKEREKKDGLQQQPEEQKQAEKPKDPKKSEADSAELVHLPRPNRSAFNRYKRPQRLGSVLNDWLPEHWRDEDCRSFGWDIVEALGYEKNENSIEIRSEWGSFARFWLKVKNKAPPILLGILREKAIEKAMFVNSTKCKSLINKSAGWFKIMYGELDSRGICLPRKSKSG